jgi:hypothetical protein
VVNELAIATGAVDYAVELAIRLVGEAAARKLTLERVEILAARLAADAEAAAKFGQVPPAADPAT